MVDYLSIPPPRTLQLPNLSPFWPYWLQELLQKVLLLVCAMLRAVKQLLAEQFGFDPLDIKGIDAWAMQELLRSRL